MHNNALEKIRWDNQSILGVRGEGRTATLGSTVKRVAKWTFLEAFTVVYSPRCNQVRSWVTWHIPHAHQVTCVTAIHWCINPAHWTHMECSIPGAQMCVAPGPRRGKNTVHTATSWSYLTAYSSQKTQDHWWGEKDMTCAVKKNKISTACHIHY